MNQGPPHLVLIPGLGADAALYEPQRRALGARLHVPTWIDPLHPHETLESYARRLARSIDSLPGLQRPYFVGGMSFGGMLAAEIAECVREGFPEDVSGLLLIGGCLDRRDVARPIRLTAALGPLVPVGPAMAMMNHLVPRLIGWQQGLDEPSARLYEQTYARGSKHLLKWGAEAMRKWETTARPAVPVFRAHGRRDAIIPIKESIMRPGVDLVVPRGKHLINLTHAVAVNRWIEKVLDGR